MSAAPTCTQAYPACTHRNKGPDVFAAPADQAVVFAAGPVTSTRCAVASDSLAEGCRTAPLAVKDSETSGECLIFTQYGGCGG